MSGKYHSNNHFKYSSFCFPAVRGCPKNQCEKFAQADEKYRDNPISLQLRGINMLFEGLKGKGFLIIVPSFVLESMNIGQ